jgi:hypothetical protein
LHHQLTLPLTERIREARLEVPVQNVVEVRLTTELVYTLRYLVAGSITKSREEGEEPLREGCSRVFAEDNRREAG